MENLTSKMFNFLTNEEPITLTKEELECLINLVVLITETDLLEYLPEDKESVIEKNTKALEELLQSNHWKGFKERWQG